MRGVGAPDGPDFYGAPGGLSSWIPRRRVSVARGARPLHVTAILHAIWSGRREGIADQAQPLVNGRRPPPVRNGDKPTRVAASGRVLARACRPPRAAVQKTHRRAGRAPHNPPHAGRRGWLADGADVPVARAAAASTHSDEVGPLTGAAVTAARARARSSTIFSPVGPRRGTDGPL